jgi:phosphoglycolate phosphatase
MRQRIRELHPFAGLEPALRGLRDQGVRCYVLSTNSRENIEAFLAQHQLQFFHELAGGSSVFGKAPHLKKLVKRENLDPAHTYYVGDEVRDVHAAREAGLRALSVTWGYSERGALVAEQPDLLADTPADMLAALTAPR